MNSSEHAKLFHDLKNDLASMTALLNLHKMYKDSISTEELLNRLYERQTVMSLAYEKLYQENDYPYISLLPFITDLISRENRTLGNYCRDVRIIKKIEDIRLPIKKLTPFAQILVELVSNSYRHAFSPSQPEKEIYFKIDTANGVTAIEYTDNGSGFDDGFNPLKSKSLGMQFIISLSKQLGGTPEFNEPEPDKGVSFKLQFKSEY